MTRATVRYSRILVKLSGEALMGDGDYGIEPAVIRRRAVRHLGKGRVTIFAAGTGNPFSTTDTAAALRSIEINADVLLNATKVNGVYSDHPLRNPSALRYTHLTFDKVLADKLNVLDATAIVMCRDNRLPLRVFNLNNPGDLTRIVRGEEVGTAVTFE